MKLIAIVTTSLFILLLLNCKTKQDFITDEIQPNQKFKTMQGKIVKVDFVNKGGRKIPGAFDYFFEIDGDH